jgi:hypothetical protein
MQGEVVMKLDEIKEIAKQHNLKTGKITKSELIRAIQLAEGNLPCFEDSQTAHCRQVHCLWRADCA